MATPKKPTGYIIYRGPSMLDGQPIVAIALTASGNRKTGNMVQTYILRDDMAPMDALRSGQDASVCGNCKHRPANGGACYVLVFQGPTVVYKALQRGAYPNAFAWDNIAALGEGRMVRLGTYGDPAAVPADVWEALVSKAQGRTGYTHQWATGCGSAKGLRGLVMASVDNPQEAAQAQAQGLRYFRIRTADEPLQRGEFVCPASDEAGKRKTCATCGACNGTSRAGQASPVIIVHGATKGRFAAQRSL